jgi:hypothetical protein
LHSPGASSSVPRRRCTSCCTCKPKSCRRAQVGGPLGSASTGPGRSARQEVEQARTGCCPPPRSSLPRPPAAGAAPKPPTAARDRQRHAASKHTCRPTTVESAQGNPRDA